MNDSTGNPVNDRAGHDKTGNDKTGNDRADNDETGNDRAGDGTVGNSRAGDSGNGTVGSRWSADLRLGRRLLTQRVGSLVLGHLYGDGLAKLGLRSGRNDPYPVYRALRARGGLTRSRTGMWAAAGHAVCHETLRDRRFLVSEESREEPPQASQAQLGDPLDLSFLDLNPPDHTRLRRLAAPAFRPKLMAGYRDRIEQTTHKLLDEAVVRGAADSGRFDLIADFAAPLPIRVISDLLGIPDVDAGRFAAYGQVVGRALDGVQSVRHAHQLLTASRDLERLFAELIELRTREPGDDVLSKLVAAGDEDKISVAEMLTMSRLLLIAGFETTVNLIGNGMLAMSQNPDEWAKLRNDPDLAPQVVEEVLRYDSPVQVTARVAGEDVEVGGQPLRKGTWVAVLLGSANRDEEVYADPDVFDISRETGAEHLSFSGGIHYCLGAPLARMEGEIAFRALAERLPDIRPSVRPRRRDSISIRGLSSFPVDPGREVSPGTGV